MLSIAYRMVGSYSEAEDMSSYGVHAPARGSEIG